MNATPPIVMNQSSTVSFAPPSAAGFAHAVKVAGAVELNRLKPVDVPWLWPGRIPLGRLTMLVGDPGLGKSLVTLDLAARLSRGPRWPDDLNPELRTLNPPASVLLLNAEDDLADTVLPRLRAAGADCSRIVAIASIIRPSGSGDAPSDFVLRRELARLNGLLDHMPECRLVVLDPVSAYFTGSANSSGEVRRLLAPLAQLAHDRNLAVLAVSHLRKQDGAATYRTLGSLVFVAAARAAWVVTRDPSDLARRLILPIKNNLADANCGLAFTIEPHVNSQPTIRWAPEPVNTSPDEALRRHSGRPRTERDVAIRWLKKKLVNGPLPASDVQEEAEGHGICRRTLRRAFRELDGEAVHLGHPILQQWLWQLPAKENQNPAPT